jgi:hypothetical protein
LIDATAQKAPDHPGASIFSQLIVGSGRTRVTAVKAGRIEFIAICKNFAEFGNRQRLRG